MQRNDPRGEGGAAAGAFLALAPKAAPPWAPEGGAVQEKERKGEVSQGRRGEHGNAASESLGEHQVLHTTAPASIDSQTAPPLAPPRIPEPW